MARKIYLSSLTAGRCFTVVASDPPVSTSEGDKEEGTHSQSLRQGRSMMDPSMAWRVLGVAGEEINAESAAGDQAAFPGKQLVIEVPRQGYDRLVERMKG